MTCALDANVLIYADVSDGSAKMLRAREAVSRLRGARIVISALALGEAFHVVTRKSGFTRAEAVSALSRWRDLGQITPVSGDTIANAADLAARHQLAIWDAAHIVAAAAAGCDVLLTEDLQDGFRWGPLLVANPFIEERWRWLKPRLAE